MGPDILNFAILIAHIFCLTPRPGNNFKNTIGISTVSFQMLDSLTTHELIIKAQNKIRHKNVSLINKNEIKKGSKKHKPLHRGVA